MFKKCSHGAELHYPSDYESGSWVDAIIEYTVNWLNEEEDTCPDHMTDEFDFMATIQAAIQQFWAGHQDSLDQLKKPLWNVKIAETRVYDVFVHADSLQEATRLASESDNRIEDRERYEVWTDEVEKLNG